MRRGERISYMACRMRVIPGRGKCLCKNPEVGACLAHSRASEEANMAGVQQSRSKVVGDEVQR